MRRLALLAGIAGLALPSDGAGACAGAAGSLGCSIIGSCSTLPVSSSVIAILNVPSTITTTLAPTSAALMELPNPAAAVRFHAGRKMASLAAVIANLAGRTG